jgi:hypothetical protein
MLSLEHVTCSSELTSLTLNQSSFPTLEELEALHCLEMPAYTLARKSWLFLVPE